MTAVRQERKSGLMAQRKKPKCKLIGENGNIFNLLAIASRTLQRSDKVNGRAKAEEMKMRVMSSQSYDEALVIISDYVDIV